MAHQLDSHVASSDVKLFSGATRSIMIKIDWTWWCIAGEFGPKWNPATAMANAKKAGVVGIELTPPEHWAALKDSELTCPLSLLSYDGCAPFDIGWNRVADRPQVLDEAKRQIALCEASDGVCNAFIGFSGKKDLNQSRETSIGNCVDGINLLLEQTAGSTAVMMFEHLNDVVVPNEAEYGKGWRCHPDYEAIDPNYPLDVVRRVNSPRVKVLFDMYHWRRQLSLGNMVEWMRRNIWHIGHIHVAGDGNDCVRGEINRGHQFTDWKATFAALRETEYQGHVGLEYIPTLGMHYRRDLESAAKLILGS